MKEAALLCGFLGQRTGGRTLSCQPLQEPLSWKMSPRQRPGWGLTSSDSTKCYNCLPRTLTNIHLSLCLLSAFLDP